MKTALAIVFRVSVAIAILTASVAATQRTRAAATQDKDAYMACGWNSPTAYNVVVYISKNGGAWQPKNVSVWESAQQVHWTVGVGTYRFKAHGVNKNGKKKLVANFGNSTSDSRIGQLAVTNAGQHFGIGFRWEPAD
jgi:hypothetical protein